MKLNVNYLFALGGLTAGVLLLAGGFGTLASDEKVWVFDDDEQHGRAYLGVRVESAAGEDGARVEKVIEETAAERAGLREDDIIVGFDGHEIDGPAELTRRIRDAEPGDEIELEVLRDGRRQVLTVDLGRRPGHRSFAWNFDDDQGFDFEFDGENLREHMEQLHEHLGQLDLHLPELEHLGFFGSRRPKLGVQLTDTTPELREHLGAPPDAGVLVGKVLSGMPAQQAGVQVGDLIVALDGETIEDAGDLIHALKDRSGETITLELIRDRAPLTLRVFIPELEDKDENARGPRAGLYRLEQGRAAEERAHALTLERRERAIHEARIAGEQRARTMAHVQREREMHDRDMHAARMEDSY